MLSEWMPYVVSIFSSVLSATITLLVCRLQIKKAKEENEIKFERDKVLLEKELEAKLQQIKEEVSYRAGVDIITNMTNRTFSAVLDTPAMKNEINKKAARSIYYNKNRKDK